MCWAALSSAILDVSNLEVHPANALLDFCKKSDIVLFNRPPPPPQSSLTAFSQLFFDAKVDIKSMSERSEHFPCWSNFFPLWLKLRTHPKKSHENWIYIENIYSDKYENWWSPIPQPQPHLGTMSPFLLFFPFEGFPYSFWDFWTWPYIHLRRFSRRLSMAVTVSYNGSWAKPKYSFAPEVPNCPLVPL